MKGVRGKNKSPGSFRDLQNWIGNPNCTIENAKYVPIGMEYLDVGIDKWLEFCQNKDIEDPLVQLALIHLEFEAIHPFLDGNGRMGRILIPLFMFEREILNSPNFYMSSYLETHKDQYVHKMRDVSKNNTWTEWCHFFLEGIIQQAEDNRAKVQSILNLQQELQDKVMQCTHSQYSAAIVELLISFPFFNKKRFVNSTGMSKGNAAHILDKLCKENIVTNMHNSGGSRANVYLFQPLLEAI